MSREIPRPEVATNVSESAADTETSPITAEALRQQMEQLKAKVAAAGVRKSQDIHKRISDRESLIVEGRKNDELTAQAKETLAYFTSMRESGQLQDSEDIKKLEELTALVNSLEKKSSGIERTFNDISTMPEVLTTLHEAANKENAEGDKKEVEKRVNNIMEQAHKEFDPQIDQLAKDVGILDQDARLSEKTKRDLEEWLRPAETNIKNTIEEHRKLLSDKSDLRLGVDRDWIESKTAAAFKQKLEGHRDSLGWFGRKDKDVINSLLEKTTSLFKNFDDAKERLANTERHIKNEETREKELEERFNAILAETWKVTEQLKKLTGRPEFENQLAWQLSSRMRGYMERLAWWHQSTDNKVVSNRLFNKFSKVRDAVNINPNEQR
jgi:hypothetical protein